jgi:hypothetical protein
LKFNHKLRWKMTWVPWQSIFILKESLCFASRRFERHRVDRRDVPEGINKGDVDRHQTVVHPKTTPLCVGKDEEHAFVCVEGGTASETLASALVTQGEFEFKRRLAKGHGFDGAVAGELRVAARENEHDRNA